MLPAPRRTPSPIHKSRPNPLLQRLIRAATYPTFSSASSSSPLVSPDSCFADDTALEQLLQLSHPSKQNDSVSASGTLSELSLISLPLSQAPTTLLNIDLDLNTETMSTSSAATNSSPRTSSPSPSQSNNAPTTPRGPVRKPKGRRTAPNSNLRCETCHQLYSRKDNLRVHQRVHTGQKPYQCRYCGQHFRWLGALRNHEGNHKRDGDHPLNPQPPNARPPHPHTTSSTTSAPNHPTQTQQLPTSIPQQPISALLPIIPITSVAMRDLSRHSSQAIPHASLPIPTPISYPPVPDLHLPLQDHHRDPAPRDVIVTDDHPAVSPLFQGSQVWGRVLDDLTPDDRSRD